MKRLLLLGITLSALAPASTILTNSPAWNGSTTVASWGNNGGSGTPTYGETITVPSDGNNVLASFTFEIFGTSPSISFDAYVQAWDGAETIGTPLFTGAGSTLTAAGAGAYTFSPGIALTPGSTYILYFSTIGISQANKDIFLWGATSSDTYAGGSFFFSNADVSAPGSGAISDLNNSAWSTAVSCCSIADLAFSATFNAPAGVPEPGGVLLVLSGLPLLLLVYRNRRGR